MTDSVSGNDNGAVLAFRPVFCTELLAGVAGISSEILVALVGRSRVDVLVSGLPGAGIDCPRRRNRSIELETCGTGLLSLGFRIES